MPGNRYFITTSLCDEAGYRPSKPGDPIIWDCGSDDTFPRFSGLKRTTPCASTDYPHGTFTMQNQGRTQDDDLHLPPGTGIPVGGMTGRNAVVVAFHFPAVNLTMHGTTEETEVRFRLKRKTPNIKRAGVLIMGGIGFIGGNTVSTVSASWTLDTNISMHLSLVHTHVHALATDVQLMVQRKKERRELVYQADPQVHTIIDRLSPEPPALRLGDSLIIQCIYNNTRSENVRVW